MTSTEPSSAAKLERLGQLINEPLVKRRLPDGYYDGITEHLEQIRVSGSDAVSESLLGNLVSLVDEYESWLVKYANQPPIFGAVQTGDQAAVLAALDAGFDIHAKDADGMTLLMLAASKGHTALVGCLIDRGADIAATCEQQNDFDAFMLACAEDHADVARLLLDHGADVNKRYAPGSSHGSVENHTALGFAANRGHLAVCHLLISRGADMEVVADTGYTAVMWALTNGASEDAALLLLERGENPDPNTTPVEAYAGASSTPLILAASNGLSRVARQLINAGVNLDAQDHSGWTALKHASRIGQDEIVHALIEAGADLNLADEEGWDPLIAAASRAGWTTMDLLMAAGADVNHEANGGQTALQQAVSRRLLRHSIVSLSRLTGRDLDPEQQEGYDMALVYAEKLLVAGASPDVGYDDDGDNKLVDEAQEQGDEELSDLLQRFGAVPSAKPEEDDEMSEQPSDADRLVLAAASIDIDEIMELLELGVDVNHLDDDGDTALGYSVIKLCLGETDPDESRDLLEQIDLLLSNGARIDVPGCRVAPLPMVARSGHLGLVKAFLSGGANPGAAFTEIDEDAGKTALEIAQEYDHVDIEAVLLAAQD